MISFDVNNGGRITLHQDGHDKPLEVSSASTGTYYITPGDVAMLLNYYRNCKRGVEKSDYINKATPIERYLAKGAPATIMRGEYEGRLVDIQPLLDGYVCGVYRFPGGDCCPAEAPALKI